MALVERYLNAVKFWLPRKQKDDIIAELGDDLGAQIEERELEVGHKLTDVEIEPILKRCGSPMTVAGRYLPQQSLIGPALFPIYRVVVRSLFFYFLLPWLVLWLGLVIFSSDFRAAHAHGELFATLEPWWLACTYSLFFCTFAFALLDRSQLGAQAVNNWKPRSLPVIRDRNTIPRSGTVVELTTMIASLAIWFEVGAFRRVFQLLGHMITLSSSWPYAFWALMVFTIISIGLACLNLINGHWTRLTAALRLGIDCYMWALAYWVSQAGLLQSISGPDLSASHAAKLVQWANYLMSSWGIWIVLIGAINLFFDIRRILGVSRTEESDGNQALFAAHGR
jgi:hypothetical protein